MIIIIRGDTVVDLVKDEMHSWRAPPSTILSSRRNSPSSFPSTSLVWYRECRGSNAREKERKRREDEGERAVEVEGRENPSHSGRHLRVIGKRIPRDSPPSNIGVAHPRRELPRDSGHPDGSVWGARPSYHRHALGECHPRVRVAHWSFRASWSSIPSGWKSSSLPRIASRMAISVSANISPCRIQDGECRAAYE